MTRACPGVTSDSDDHGCYPCPSWAPRPHAEEREHRPSCARGCVCKGDLRGEGARAPLFTQQPPCPPRGSPRVSGFCSAESKARREVWAGLDESKWARRP